MAEQAIADSDEGLDVEAVPRSGGMSGKKVVLFVAVPLLLLSIGGGVAAFMLGVFDGDKAAEETVEEAEATEGPAVFFDLPDMLVNLNTGTRRSSFLKISVALELSAEKDRETLQQVQPRIVDSFQVYLRELRIEDLSGSAGLQRLREELLLRVNAAAHPVVVRDVLFKQMLVQ